jgi:hypothetical protein
MLNKKDEMKAHATVFIGAYLIIRGLSFFLGGFPNEAQTFNQVKEGNFKLSGYIYLYFLLFVALNVAGTWVQHKTDPEILMKDLAAEEKKHDSEADNFLRQKQHVDCHH